MRIAPDNWIVCDLPCVPRGVPDADIIGDEIAQTHGPYWPEGWTVYEASPSLTTYDYSKMKKKMGPIRAELLARVMHPNNLSQLHALHLV
jgi:hypothetical protein